MKIFLFISWLAATFFVFTQGAFCQSQKDVILLDTVVVTAEEESGNYQTGDVDIQRTTGFSTVINRDAFQGKMENLAAVIEREAGVQVRKSGGFGSFSTVSMRGSSSEQVAVYLDGVLLNDASGGGVDLSNISLSDVESIEIYRGATPGNFGKGAMGGTVNIKTVRAEKGFKANAVAGYGAFSRRALSGFLNHKPGKWDYLISAEEQYARNDFEFLNDNGTTWNLEDDRVENRHNAETLQQNILAKVGHDFTGDLRVDILHQWFSKNQGLPSWNNSANTKTSYDMNRNVSILKVTSDDMGPRHLNASASVEYLSNEEEYDDSHGSVGMGYDRIVYNTDRYGADFFLEWQTESNTLSFILDGEHETYEPEYLIGDKPSSESTRESFSVRIMDVLTLLDQKLMITPLIRYSGVKDRLESSSGMWGSKLQERDRSEEYFTPQVGIKYRALPWLIFKGNLGKYVREPSFFELFGDRGFFIGNMELEEEQGVNWDAGFQMEIFDPGLSFERVSLDAAYFNSDIDDLITRSYNSRGVGKSENTASASIQGVELTLNLDFLKHFRLIGNATFQDTENHSEIKAFDGKKLPGRFETSFLARMETRHEPIKVFLEYVSEKGLYYDTANLLDAEDKEEINAGLTTLFGPATLNFEVKNIGDDRYEDFNGYPTPGTSWYISLKYDF